MPDLPTWIKTHLSPCVIEGISAILHTVSPTSIPKFSPCTTPSERRRVDSIARCPKSSSSTICNIPEEENLIISKSSCVFNYVFSYKLQNGYQKSWIRELTVYDYYIIVGTIYKSNMTHINVLLLLS